MNTVFWIVGICNIVIFCGTVRKNGGKRNIFSYLNLMLGLFLIISSFTLFKHLE